MRRDPNSPDHRDGVPRTPSAPLARLCVLALLLPALAVACSDCDGVEAEDDDLGTFVEEEFRPPTVFNPPDPGNNPCGYGGSGGSGGGSNGASNGGCDELTQVDCAWSDCGYGDCVTGNNGSADRCACDDGYTGTYCTTCAPGFIPIGLQCVPCSEASCTHGTCVEARLGGSRCACDEGYRGALCDACAEGWRAEGDRCVPDDDGPCAPNPCALPGQVCTPAPDDRDAYTCACDAGLVFDRGACRPACDASDAACAAAQTSADHLSSANGHGAVAYNTATHTLDALFEHTYKNWDADVHTRDLLHDTYVGVRTPGAESIWLGGVAPVSVDHYAQTGVIHTVHEVATLRVETFAFAPWALGRPAMALITRVTQLGRDQAPVSLFTLHNYRLGTTSPDNPVYPNADDERAQHDAASGGVLETGPGGVLLHLPLGDATHYGFSPNNPYAALLEGRDLDDPADSGVGPDRVVGFQRDAVLEPGQSVTFGVVTALERFGDVDALRADALAAFGDLSAEDALQAELSAWEAWRAAPPGGLSPAEQWVWRQAEATLRQGQVWETSDRSMGQLVAALPPGPWNIAWTRHMAYGAVALAKMGHGDEARAALDFIMGADSGLYQDPYVGAPYQVSVARYYGRGREESDVNADGPNIELDGFGLALWAAAAYLDATGDQATVARHWPALRDRVAEPLIGLIDPATGLIRADSSIWEVHWNGQQRQHAYTTLAAARGLCDAARLARAAGDDASADRLTDAGLGLQSAAAARLRDPSGALVATYEAARAQPGAGTDIAPIEAFNWGLFDPQGATAAATWSRVEADLRTPNGLGLMRNDGADAYNRQDWVFANLRAARARQLAADPTNADALLGWVTAQARANYGMIAEQHHPTTGLYQGDAPMTAYGAAAYILALLGRADADAPLAPACGQWAQP